MRRRKTKEEFIKDTVNIHKDRYDYSRVNYVSNKSKIIIICKQHGEFKQTPSNHLKGKGCPKCAGNYNRTTEEFIQDAKQIHRGKYDYSKVEYLNAKTKVCIICPEHGEFWQLPTKHLRGRGCVLCGYGTQGKVKITNTLSKKFEGLIQPEDYKLIPLTQGKYAMVDNEDFDKVKDINWKYSRGYAKNNNIGMMHRIIMNCPDDKVVDHINHDTSDNRKSNLRVCTQSENMRNMRGSKNSTSRYVGVSWNKYLNKWEVYAHVEGSKMVIGYYKDEEDAGRARDKNILELRGEFAYLNFPELKEEYLKEIEANGNKKKG